LPIHHVIAGFAEQSVTAEPAEQAIIARTTAQHVQAGATDQSVLEATGAAPYDIVAAIAE
jgi:hypothetical protein